jgi:hypothetical protein
VATEIAARFVTLPSAARRGRKQQEFTMTRLAIALPLVLLAPFAAAPAMAEGWRDTVLAGVAERTTARVEARETIPAGAYASPRLETLDARIAQRAEAGAPRLRPDVRLVRRTTRIEGRLAD